MRHRSSLLLAACVSYLGCILGASLTLELEPTLAQASANPPDHFLVAQSPSPTTANPTFLRRGSKGQDVVELQAKLKQLGYYNGATDGVYGESTELAVSNFQKAASLEASGIAGPTTQDSLTKAQAEKSATTTVAANSDPATAKSSSSNKNGLKWLIAAGVILAIAGGGIFVLLKVLNKPKKAGKPKPLANEDNLPTLNSSNGNGKANGTASQTARSEPEPHTNGHNLSALKNSHPSPPETQFNIERSKDSLAVNPTSRLSTINIVEELIRDLQEPDPQKRRKAIWELAQRGDSRAMQPLVDLMLDADSKQRSLILEALGQICSKTLKPMNRALAISLQDENAEVRKNAIRDVTRVYEYVTQLSQMLRHAAQDPDPEVRETARWAISQLNRIRISPPPDSLPSTPSSLHLPDNYEQKPPQ